MKNSRREFIKAGAIGAALAATGLPVTGHAVDSGAAAKQGLKLLILGGTGFIGPHMVREALRRGHSVTLFNRGRTNATLFPDLETIKGDRDGGLSSLQGREWDAVIDNSGYVPRHVADSAHLLAPNVGRYVFISSVSVYADFDVVNNEESPLATIADETVEEVTGETYGALKALCEQAAASEIGDDKLTVLRPTYICGPGDHTDRFVYWPLRARRAGRMLWPGTPQDIIQVIDVRDLAHFTIDGIERQVHGVYNLVNPRGASTMGTLLRDCQAITARGGEAIWVDAAFLASQGVHGGVDLPIWFNSNPTIGFTADRALRAGLHNRPVRETARDLLAWWDSLPRQRTAKPRAGLSPMKEAEVIAAWRKRR